MKKLILVFMLSLSFGSIADSVIGEMPACDSPAAVNSKCDCLKTTDDGTSRVFTYDATGNLVPKAETGTGTER